MVRGGIRPWEVGWARPSGSKSFLSEYSHFFNKTLLDPAFIQRCPSPPLMLKFLFVPAFAKRSAMVFSTSPVCPRIQPDQSTRNLGRFLLSMG